VTTVHRLTGVYNARGSFATSAATCSAGAPNRSEAATGSGPATLACPAAMALSAVLDTNVLYRFSLRDTLLRLAELELYTPLWSARIFKEMARNLVEHQITEQQAARVQTAMRETLLRKLKATPRGIDRPSLR
jgi:hypothetical protein